MLYHKQGESVSVHAEPPVYIGNTIASDFLYLKGNEWLESADIGEIDLKRTYNVLSIGCGDLRSTVFTIASLPEQYK